ncbi:unnamed protein product [Cladocopium goreaui]|uniref:Smr domain-containing protein n=1 Tax=Cladocopium goreaui TaxID=2562237 RepID=A0A9P1BH61_9DINO|nr:unnamed protein product [Cladocopium goreaui]
MAQGPLYGAKEVTVLLASLARRALWRSAVTLLFTAEEVLDLPCLGAALQACEKSGQWQMALMLLEDFSSRRLLPDGGALASALLATGRAGAWQQGCWILKMVRSGKWNTKALPKAEWSRVATAAVSVCGQQRQWRMATQVLEVLQQDGLQLTVVPFNAWMRWTRPSSAHDELCNQAFGARARGAFSAWEAHMKVAEELSVPGSCVPDQITLNSVVQSCAEIACWEASLALVKAAPSWLDVKPDAVSLAA